MTSAIGMPNSKSVVKALPSQMTVLPNGNVGIGTTNPQAILHLTGHLRMQPIRFRYFQSSTTIPSSTLTVIRYSSASLSSIYYNTSSWKFVVPVSGLYSITIKVDLLGAGGTGYVVEAHLYKNAFNDRLASTQVTRTTSERQLQLHTIVELLQNDEIQAVLFQNTGAVAINASSAEWSEFSGYLVG
jgi:hypothetical protein